MSGINYKPGLVVAPRRRRGPKSTVYKNYEKIKKSRL